MAESVAPSPDPPRRGEGAGEEGAVFDDEADSDPLPPGGGGSGRGGASEAIEAVHSFTVRLIDTPGLEEVGDEGRGHLATEAARRADLVLFVLAEDLTATARKALVGLREIGKPIVVALNKVDLLGPDERDAILAAVRSGLAGLIPAEDIIPIAAAPIVRRRVVLADGLAGRDGPGRAGGRRAGGPAPGGAGDSAGDLKELAEASATVERHVLDREADRARLRERAERVADETSAALAVALAVNPIPLLDFLTGPGRPDDPGPPGRRRLRRADDGRGRPEAGRRADPRRPGGPLGVAGGDGRRRGDQARPGRRATWPGP